MQFVTSLAPRTRLMQQPARRHRPGSPAEPPQKPKFSQGPQIAKDIPLGAWMLTYRVSPSGLNVDLANSSSVRSPLVRVVGDRFVGESTGRGDRLGRRPPASLSGHVEDVTVRLLQDGVRRAG